MKFLLLYLFLFFSVQAFGTAVDVSNPNQEYIGQQTKLYNDKNFNHPITTIEQLEPTAFKPVEKDIHSHFFTNDTLWYTFEVLNPTSTNIERYFVFDIPWLDDIEIYITHMQNEKHHYQLGNTFVFSQRTYPTNLLNVKHQFTQGISKVYVKVKTRDPFIVPISLLSQEELIKKVYTKNSGTLAIYSVILAMMLFNFILYFIIKHPSYLYYSLFLVSFIAANASYNNYTFQYFLFNYPTLQNWSQSIFLYCFSICGLLFTNSFLNLKILNRRLYFLTYKVILLIIVIFCLTALLGYGANIAFSIIVGFIFGIYSLIIAIYALQQKNSAALFFILGLSTGLTGTIITALSVSAFIPFNIYTYKAVDYGILIDTILLSIALAKRFTLMYEDLQKTQNELQELSLQLEQKVEERTFFLNKELENNKLLVKEVYHRVKNNLQIISSLLILQTKTIRDVKAKQVLQENIQRIEAISILHEKIFKTKDLKQINLKHYVKDIIFDFIDLTGTNQLNFDLNIKPISIGLNNLIPIGLIINELLTNSFKYAFSHTLQPHILIEFYPKDEYVYFKYKDNGKGANLEDFQKGFGFLLLDSLSIYQLNAQRDFFNNKGFNYTLKFPKATLSN